MEHDRWCARHLLDGWRRGAARDDVARTHPCLIPWEQLTEHYRDNDRASVRQLPELLALIGQRIVREESAGTQEDTGVSRLARAG
jgi:hypothetical protein